MPISRVSHTVSLYVQFLITFGLQKNETLLRHLCYNLIVEVFETALFVIHT